MHTTPTKLEQIPELIILLDETKLRVSFLSRIPTGFECGLKM